MGRGGGGRGGGGGGGGLGEGRCGGGRGGGGGGGGVGFLSVARLASTGRKSDGCLPRVMSVARGNNGRCRPSTVDYRSSSGSSSSGSGGDGSGGGGSGSMYRQKA